MNSFQTKYKVLNKIGEGSFSEVLKCEEKKTGQLFAAKRLKKIYKSLEESIMQCAEIIASQKVSFHPNILNMLEFHYDSFAGKVIFIFELMDMSMHDYIKTKTRCIPEFKVKDFLYQMLKGMEHLHKSGLFHRDIKPENILIKLPGPNPTRTDHVENEVIKLADLGSVRGVYSIPPYTEYISTRWYRSPECLLTVGHYGAKMDIWAAGCVFFEMLTLRPLFPGTNEIDQLAKIHAILGTPSAKLISKLKTKSRNCSYFPKMKGSGVEHLLPNISVEGKNVLKLMIEYDPDKRTNVKRLLRNTYFSELKNSELIESKKLGSKNHLHNYKSCMGDDWSIPVVKSAKEAQSLKRYILADDAKRTVNSKCSSTLSKCSKGSRKSKSSSKSSLESDFDVSRVPLHSPPLYHKQMNHNLRNTSLPLVDFKLFKTWGVDPKMLKPKEVQIPRVTNSLSEKPRPKKAQSGSRYDKNISHTKSNHSLEAMQNRFLSKSLVLPLMKKSYSEKGHKDLAKKPQVKKLHEKRRV